MIATQCRGKAGKMSDSVNPDPGTRCGLRLVGVDTAYANDADDDALIEQANASRRVLLVSNRGDSGR